MAHTQLIPAALSSFAVAAVTSAAKSGDPEAARAMAPGLSETSLVLIYDGFRVCLQLCARIRDAKGRDET